MSSDDYMKLLNFFMVKKDYLIISAVSNAK